MKTGHTTPNKENYMVEFNHAIALILKNSQPLDSENIPIQQSLGRVLNSAIMSPAEIPPFNNSAMDGYAVNFDDIKVASKESPITLDLIGLTAAGDEPSYQPSARAEMTHGKAWKIMTGAQMPSGFDSVIPIENTTLLNNVVSCYNSLKRGSNVRKRGEDFTLGEAILSAGKVIDANTISACASLGLAELEVVKKINISFFATGKELIDDPTQPLMPGQIRASNKSFALNWLKKYPVNVLDRGTNPDDVKKFEYGIQNEINKNTHIIISSGAVSMGDFDFVPQTIIKLGGEIIFHKARIRPGKPILFAKFPNGSLYFGLPGNPISAIIGLRFFVLAAIFNLLGLKPEKPVKAIASHDFKKKLGFKAILKAQANVNSSAQFEANILSGQESFKIKPLLKANGWAVISEENDHFTKGDLIDFYPNATYWE
jgi:molybdopterin molybdotransferase